MLVADVMQSKVLTVTPRTTLADALCIMQRGIRHLPVVDNDRLVGIVSDRDLKRAMAPPSTTTAGQVLTYIFDRKKVEEVMTRAVITVTPTFPVEEAARIMVTERISALPVVDGGRVVGIVTETDVLEVVVRALGAGEPSSRLDVALGPERAALAELVHAIEGAGAPIASIVTLKNREGLKLAVVRIATINPGPAVAALESHGFSVRNSRRGYEPSGR
jgi:acetoin utilization protein AcuB